MGEQISTLEAICKAQEAEIARLRALLDDIHRGRSDRPPVPKRYDEAAQDREDSEWIVKTDGVSVVFVTVTGGRLRLFTDAMAMSVFVSPLVLF
jgi:hypothetical protein